MQSYENLIGGSFQEAAKTRTISDPANGEPIAVVPESSAADVEKAVTAARTAFDTGPWRKTSAQDRGRQRGAPRPDCCGCP